MDERFDRDDEALERELLERGPRMLRQEEIEAQGPDPEFVRSLRHRLTGESEGVRTRRVRKQWWTTWTVWGGAAGAAAAIILIVLLLRPPGGSRIRTEAFTPPTPSRSDILRGYPPLEGQGGGFNLAPCSSGEETVGARAYPRPIRIAAGEFAPSPARLPAYRLAGPSFDIPRIQSIAHFLGIHGGVRRVRLDGGPALCVSERTGTGGPTPGFRSVIISTRTGEVYVRDVEPVRPSTAPVNASSNVAAARRWLQRLGWPALPVHFPLSATEAGMQGAVLLGWNGVGQTNLPAATLQLDTHGRVRDAHLWPPVVARTSTSVKSYRSAFVGVTRGAVPLSIEPPPRELIAGSGSVASMRQVEALTLTSSSTYLAPAYRFSGPVRLGGFTYRWSAVVPAG